MTAKRWVRVIASALVLVSLALGVEASPVFLNPHFLWLATFVGANLLQSGFTRICPLESILRRFGVKSASAS